MTEPVVARGPFCGRSGCGQTAAVQWQRRSADEADSTDAVYACVAHAITLDLAAHVHAPTCPGPAAATLPQCGCTVEPLPAPDPGPEPPQLPPGW